MDKWVALRLAAWMPAIFMVSWLAAYVIISAVVWLLSALWLYLLIGAVVIIGLFVLAVHVS